MSYFNRQRVRVLDGIKKAEARKFTAAQRLSILKADSEPMQASAQATQASGAAYSNQTQSPPPMAEQIAQHKKAATLHEAAAKAHRTAGKAVMKDTPTVGQAHYQQAQSHDQMVYSHQQQAQSMQDAKDCGYDQDYPSAR